MMGRVVQLSVNVEKPGSPWREGRSPREYAKACQNIEARRENAAVVVCMSPVADAKLPSSRSPCGLVRLHGGRPPAAELDWSISRSGRPLASPRRLP